MNVRQMQRRCGWARPSHASVLLGRRCSYYLDAVHFLFRAVASFGAFFSQHRSFAGYFILLVQHCLEIAYLVVWRAPQKSWRIIARSGLALCRFASLGPVIR